jgi:hypothetical protein
VSFEVKQGEVVGILSLHFDRLSTRDKLRTVPEAGDLS